MNGTPAPDKDPAQVHLVGVGPGPVDLLTVRASRLIALSGTCLYEHGPVPPQITALCSPTALVVDTTSMPTADAVARIRAAVARGDRVVRLYPGDPTQHPDLTELTRALDAEQVDWELVPGVPTPADPESPSQPTTPRSADGTPATAHRPMTNTARPTQQPPSASSAAPLSASASSSSPAPLSSSSIPAAATLTAPQQARFTDAPGLILILGGTGEARRLADLLVTAGLDVVTSLAGKVSRPRLPRGEVRIGGFGGTDGLAHWVRENAVSAVIDATDPFATDISGSAVEAARATGVPLLRLHRPPWTADDRDNWISVPDMDAAVSAVSGRFRRPMLTVGKLGASAFADDPAGSYLIRCAEPPPGRLPHRYLLVLDRGPFGVESERALMSRHRIDVLVTRNSGGESAQAKLTAARALHIPVVMVERPDATQAPEAPDTVHSVDEAARWLVGRFGSR